MTTDELQSRMDDIISAVATIVFTEQHSLGKVYKMELVSKIYENYAVINEAAILKDIKVIEDD